MGNRRSRSTLEQVKEPEPRDLRPSEFMRARRPELFSDSKVIGEPRLTREVFEYHLETLTNRKQETEFEHFCRLLAEKELCPNLLPQTGPTGGGDSKVDAETYPVSDEITMRWYEGVGREAVRERWAFAFSAKKAWRSKVQSDVEKIVAAKRGYKLVYFITNQFVRDKVRAEVEDQLKKKHKIDVRILDRTWIVRCVFDNRRLQLAIDALNLTSFDEVSHRVTGPQDTRREEELRELEDRIKDPARYKGVEYQLAEDCLHAALLARGLELPRHEVEGRFLRAEHIAEKTGHVQQRLRIAYNRAWTAFWWYEDFAELNRLYDQVEQLAVGSPQATDLERLTNLWTLIRTSVNKGELDTVTAKFDARTKTLKSALDRLSSDDSRPNNALLARTHRLMIELPDAAEAPQRLDPILQELKGIMAATEGLTAYPVETIAKLIRELGEVLAESERYDELFETIVKVTERRASEGEAGRALMERGYQKLRKHKTYDAIRLLGRAQQKLAMREHREELVSALVGCGLAYESAGLLWAARANVIAAANQAFSEYWEQGKISYQVLLCLRKLIWLELQIGRLPFVLAWMELASIIAGQFVQREKQQEAFMRERMAQDQVLAILLLKTDVWELKWLDFLPEILDNLRLDYSWMALLYALGYEPYLRSEGAIPEGENQEAVLDLFRRWVEQPVAEDIPEQAELFRGSTVVLRSFVLGCEVVVEAVNNRPSVYLAEAILTALEALMATSLDARAFPHASELNIIVEPSDFVDRLPEFQIDDERQTVTVKHSPDILHQMSDDPGAFRSWLQEFIIEVAFRITVVEDLDSYAGQLFGAEAGLGRAFSFSETSIPVSNILGVSPKFHLSDWEAKAKGERFPLKRNTPWDHGLKRAPEKSEADQKPLQFGEGDPPPELLDVDKLKHKDRRVISLINIPLWDKADWQAALYAVPPELDYPPYLGLGFRDAEAARAIFRGLHNKLGMIDRDEQLRVSIITGVDKNNPSHYMVVIGSSLKNDWQSSHVVMVSKMRLMVPPDSRNLDRFLRRYERIGKYLLLPAHYEHEEAEPTLFDELAISKQELHVRAAWQIGEHDTDTCALLEGSEPIIPEGVENPPVLRALERLAARGRNEGSDEGLSEEAVSIIKFYSEELGTSDLKIISTCVEYLSKAQPKGHWTCYCTSGKKLRQCHMEKLMELRGRVSTVVARRELAQLKGQRSI